MSLGLGTIAPPRPTSSHVADALRRAILRGQLKGGQPLKQDIIADEFKISKIPVREALNQLAAEGLVEFRPNRGAFVTTLSAAEMSEIYLMRGALETLALRQAVAQMTAADLEQAEGVLHQIDAVTEIEEWAELNWLFHTTLYRPSGLTRIIHICHNLHTNVVRYLLIHGRIHRAGSPYFVTSQAEHYQILALCRERQSEAAVTLLACHLAEAGAALTTAVNGKSLD